MTNVTKEAWILNNKYLLFLNKQHKYVYNAYYNSIALLYYRQNNNKFKWYHCDGKHITETNLLTLSNNVYLMFYAKEVDLGT